MANVTEAKNVKVGDYIHTADGSDIREVYKVTRSGRVEDIFTGKLKFTTRRFYFTSSTGAAFDVERNAETLISVF